MYDGRHINKLYKKNSQDIEYTLRSAETAALWTVPNIKYYSGDQIKKNELDGARGVR